jgi:hypothetical protein
MQHWTTHELRRLDEAYQDRQPTRAELAVMFPRHPPGSVFRYCCYRGLRKRNPQLEWLTIAHLYFSRREAEMRRPARRSVKGTM